MRVDELCCGKHVEVKRKCWTGQPEAARDCPCGKSIGRLPDKQPKNIEAGFLCQSGERINGK